MPFYRNRKPFFWATTNVQIFNIFCQDVKQQQFACFYLTRLSRLSGRCSVVFLFTLYSFLREDHRLRRLNCASWMKSVNYGGTNYYNYYYYSACYILWSHMEWDALLHWTLNHRITHLICKFTLLLTYSLTTLNSLASLLCKN